MPSLKTLNANPHQLEPKPLWDIFHLFTQHPRPSKHEEAILSAIESLCDERKLEHRRDDIGNLIIRKPATPGMEKLKGVVMQGHIDMVPQKSANSHHNFLTDPIQTEVISDNGATWLTAKGTTLGADNGIGVAAALAVLISNDLEHGPLELLITIDEEAGMTGAEHLKPGWLHGDILLNLDTEDEGELYVGCAGGVDISAQLPITKILTTNESAYEITVSNLRGGHSGLDINAGRANANKLIIEFLKTYLDPLQLQLIHINGGTLRNALAREASIQIALPTEKAAELESAVAKYLIQQKTKYQETDPNIQLTLSPVKAPEYVYDLNSTHRLIAAVNECIHGVTAMSQEFNGVVQTSNNLAIVKTDSTNEAVTLMCLARSLSDDDRDGIAHQIKAQLESHQATVTLSGQYPGWQPNPKSKMLTLMSDLHEKEYGTQPEIKVIHAGLECGLLGKAYPHWDMISFGPTIRHAHSPDERVHIKSVLWFWDFLLATLKNIPLK